ncbi:hypothetical protein [Adlercreutzia caecimuris]|uniref:hypothetical protein n=1 Tax=Adlercreutzia caecimuris TaxID=671266 RepID=UPI001C3CACA8|nr:hypothetical protein [Adlercreutzia caecimuris]
MGRSSGNDIERTVNAFMRECVDANEEVLQQRAQDAGKQAVKALKHESRKRTGKYAKGWKSTAQRGATGVEVTVHDTQYQLTRLLENDHAIKNQTGRTFGTAKGDKVISRIADRIGRQFSGGDAK